MSKQLTAAAVAKMRPGKDRREIPDAGCPGLYLIIQPSGAKGWALRYRRPDGRPAKLVLGSVFAKTAETKEPDTVPAVGDHMTLAAAHRLVSALRHEIAQGRDPAAAHLKEKKQRRILAAEATGNTFAVAARDFIAQHSSEKVRRWHEHARLLGLEPDTLAPIPKGLADRWAARPFAEIDGHDIHAIVDETRRLGAPGLERRSSGPTESRARAMFAVLSKLFAWLIEKRRIEVNPCASVHRPETAKVRDRVLSNPEIAQFWHATDAVSEPYTTLLRVLLLTGCRLNEVAGMRHGEIEGDQWLIPGERTKNHRAHVVPLPPLARDILGKLKRIEGCPYMFSTTGRSHVASWSGIKKSVDVEMKPATPWRLHDLRRTAATGMAEIGIDPHIVEACLNHVSGARAGVAGTYNRAAYAPQKKAALERWAAHVEGLVSGKAATVTPLRPRASP